MLRCREVVELVGTGGWRESPLRVRLALALHLMMCRHCRGYTRQLRMIGRQARALFRLRPREVAVEQLVARVRAAAEDRSV